MRFPIWIPRTPFGLLASILAGITIAAVLWFGLFGAPSFNAPRGTEAYFRDEEAVFITMIATLAGGSWIGTRLERRRLSPQTRLPRSFKELDRWFWARQIRKEGADRLIAEAARQGQSTTPPDPPATLDEALARLPMPPVPPGMRDPGTDANFASYARILTSATWHDWQLVHIRVEDPRVVDVYQALIGRVGEDQAKTMCTIANRAGASVNFLLLGYFVRQMEEAEGHDPRLARTWLDILGAHEGPHFGTVVQGAWGILLRDLLPFDARDQCYQPFARCVDAAVFGLEGVYQWGVEGPA